jgi:hypothetical protein
MPRVTRRRRDVKGIDERNLAIRQSANAVIEESEKLVKEYCDGAGPARRKNLGAWMEHLQKAGGACTSSKGGDGEGAALAPGPAGTDERFSRTRASALRLTGSVRCATPASSSR